MGIDLGSSNFRIILADLSHDDPKFDTEADPLPKEYYSLPCKNVRDTLLNIVELELEILSFTSAL